MRSAGAANRTPGGRLAGFAALTLLAAGVALSASAPVAADGIMLVPAGAFWMGQDGGPAAEGPRHRVYVRDFWIERHKVTNAEFAAFLNARGPIAAEGIRRYDWDDPDARIHRSRPLGPPGAPPGPWAADAGFEQHPAVEVSWYGARDYCQWIERRLPTEAEWEKAARGDDSRSYPWGFEPPTPARSVAGRPYGATQPTDDGRPAGASPHHVHDMLGNLREWTATILRPYPYRADDGREPFAGQGEVVVRGASHDDPPETLAVTARHSYGARGARAGHHHVGFRCATSEDLGGR